MHSFADLVDRSTSFGLATLKAEEDEIIEALQTSGATRHVKNLQAIQLHRAIVAIGIFSIFESPLLYRAARVERVSLPLYPSCDLGKVSRARDPTP